MTLTRGSRSVALALLEASANEALAQGDLTPCSVPAWVIVELVERAREQERTRRDAAAEAKPGALAVYCTNCGALPGELCNVLSGGGGKWRDGFVHPQRNELHARRK